MLREILEAAGYTVESAANGRVAIELLDRLAPDAAPGLLILDLNMPVMDGWALLAHVRARPHLATIPIAVQSGDEDSTLPDGISFVLRKPVDVDALLAAVKHYCP